MSDNSEESTAAKNIIYSTGASSPSEQHDQSFQPRTDDGQLVRFLSGDPPEEPINITPSSIFPVDVSTDVTALVETAFLKSSAAKLKLDADKTRIFYRCSNPCEHEFPVQISHPHSGDIRGFTRKLERGDRWHFDPAVQVHVLASQVQSGEGRLFISDGTRTYGTRTYGAVAREVMGYVPQDEADTIVPPSRGIASNILNSALAGTMSLLGLGSSTPTEKPTCVWIPGSAAVAWYLPSQGERYEQVQLTDNMRAWASGHTRNVQQNKVDHSVLPFEAYTDPWAPFIDTEACRNIIGVAIRDDLTQILEASDAGCLGVPQDVKTVDAVTGQRSDHTTYNIDLPHWMFARSQGEGLSKDRDLSRPHDDMRLDYKSPAFPATVPSHFLPTALFHSSPIRLQALKPNMSLTTATPTALPTQESIDSEDKPRRDAFPYAAVEVTSDVTNLASRKLMERLKLDPDSTRVIYEYSCPMSIDITLSVSTPQGGHQEATQSLERGKAWYYPPSLQVRILEEKARRSGVTLYLSDGKRTYAQSASRLMAFVPASEASQITTSRAASVINAGVGALSGLASTTFSYFSMPNSQSPPQTANNASRWLPDSVAVSYEMPVFKRAYKRIDPDLETRVQASILTMQVQQGETAKHTIQASDVYEDRLGQLVDTAEAHRSLRESTSKGMKRLVDARRQGCFGAADDLNDEDDEASGVDEIVR